MLEHAMVTTVLSVRKQCGTPGLTRFPFRAGLLGSSSQVAVPPRRCSLPRAAAGQRARWRGAFISAGFEERGPDRIEEGSAIRGSANLIKPGVDQKVTKNEAHFPGKKLGR